MTLWTHGSPSRLRILHVGGYWRKANDVVRHMMLGLRDTGAEVFEYDTDAHRDVLDTEGRPYDRGTTGPVWLRWKDLQEDLHGFDPHLIVCNAGGLAFRPEDARRLRRDRCLLGIALSDPDVFEPTTRHIAPTFDQFRTNAPQTVERYRALGVDAAQMPMATNPKFFRPVAPRPEMQCDVLVIGAAHPDRIEPVRAVAERFDLHLYGEGWEAHGLPSRGLIFDREALAAFNSARVTLLFDRTPGGHRLIKVWLFDYIAAGALVLTNRSPELAAYFDLDRELLTFSSTPELLMRIESVLRNPEDMESIRRAGRQRVLRDYTWSSVWRRVLRALQSDKS